MKRKCARLFILFGTMLLLAALFLVLFNLHQDKKSGEISQSVLSELKEMIPQKPIEKEDDEEIDIMPSIDLYEEYEEDQEEEVISLSTIQIDGNEYVGYITIPEIGIELPVMSEWNYNNLKIAPCLYNGTPKTSDMIIAAHNYNSHFGRISKLNVGDSIIFTNAEGEIYNYEVVQTDLVGGYDVESMFKGAANNWDLTIFTCTLNSQSRVSVRAVEVDKD